LFTGGNQQYYRNSTHHQTHHSQSTLHIQPRQFQQTQAPTASLDHSRVDVSWSNLGGSLSHLVSTADTVTDVNLMTTVRAGIPSLLPIQSTLSQSVPSVSSLMTVNHSAVQQNFPCISSASGPSTLQVWYLYCVIVSVGTETKYCNKKILLYNNYMYAYCMLHKMVIAISMHIGKTFLPITLVSTSAKLLV